MCGTMRTDERHDLRSQSVDLKEEAGSLKAEVDDERSKTK